MFLAGFRVWRFTHLPSLFCANPACHETLPAPHGRRARRIFRWELCPSCRLAFGRGAALAFALGLAWRALAWWLR